MLTPRGVSVAVAGVAMWLAARFLGSPDWSRSASV
jgi:hypothetical protein